MTAESDLADALHVVCTLKASPGALTAAEIVQRTQLGHDAVLTALRAAERAGVVQRCPSARPATRYRTTEACW